MAINFSVYSGKSVTHLQQYLNKINAVGLVRFEGPRVYLDTFDRRLLRKKTGLYLQKNDLTYVSPDCEYPDSIKVKRIPKRPEDLPPGNIRAILESVIGVRALMPMIKEKICSEHYAVMDVNQKTVLRITIEKAVSHENMPVVIQLYPVKGYEEAITNISAELPDLGFHPDERNFFKYLIEKNQIITDRYSTQKSYPINSNMTVAQAIQAIHRQLLSIMRENEGGIIKDIDTEFLHDFRVAVRRIRSLYGQAKHVISASVFRQVKTDFSELGRRTNRLRDIDVYLLNRSSYENLLPAPMQDVLKIFFDQLKWDRKAEHSRFARYLQSDIYHKTIAKWEKYLAEDSTVLTIEELPVMDFACAQILQKYQRVLESGDRITDQTPDAKLHKLRIAGKKLRYTLEFFTRLFDSEVVADMIRHLKKLQDNLGAFNDLSIQQKYLHDFAVDFESADGDLRPTIIAFGVLIGRLYTQQRRVRQEFSENCEYFSETRNSKWIDELSNFKKTDLL